MKQTAVEWLWEQYNNECDCGGDVEYTLAEKLFTQAKEIERIEKLKRQLFIGKVSEIIGERKTVDLLKECIETFKSE